ncbi:hypothetical protein CCM_05553 [Cordyceps militaris CM01]|uniref:Uncharacterized protein n=1 Tax=Cordyceps militaris (strain CM01) TaxID=983644 RepID=G3JKB1_CORMM|nr:uncharacterized protein CCM_05553 [Cordyceps militaris CM01]EGX91395.1 hypothetical protein CCM_05553 [Cordyceps militaris CM01]
MFALRNRAPLRPLGSLRRMFSTLPNNEFIRVFKDPASTSSILTYLDSDPPSKRLAIGTTTELPPTPRSFTENKQFLQILDRVLREYGHLDDDVISQARTLASPPQFQFSPGGGSPRRKGGARSEPQGASGQGGAGGAGVGSFVHLGDRRHPPEFGRIAWPEDILGSVEVDNTGEVSGKLEPSGTYRPVTNDGILGLSPFIRGKLIERLKSEEAKEKRQ